MGVMFSNNYPVIAARQPIECTDVVDRPLCEGAQACGTSVLDRCTCGLRRAMELRGYGERAPAANQQAGLRRM